jgi:hypothetical protein
VGGDRGPSRFQDHAPVLQQSEAWSKRISPAAAPLLKTAAF